MKWMAIESTEGYFQDSGLEKWITENNLLIFSAAQQRVHKPPQKREDKVHARLILLRC